MGHYLGDLARIFRQIFLLDSKRTRNPAMEGLRGYAIFLIFLTHFYTPLKGGKTVEAALSLLQRSQYGVDIFFLLSGFLVFRLLKKTKVTSLSELGTFFLHRAMRIYPTFVAMILLGFLLKYPAKWSEVSALTIVKNLLFLNGIPGYRFSMFELNPWSWSLFYEWTFYLAAPLLMFVGLNRRKSTLGWRALQLFVVAGCCFVFGPMPRWWMMLAGGALAVIGEARLRQVAATMPDALVAGVFLASAALFGYSDLKYDDYHWFTPIFCLSSSILFVKACFGEGSLKRLFSWVPLRFLGNVSYSMYLTTGYVFGSMDTRFHLENFLPSNALGVLAAMAVLLAACAAFAALFFLVTERWYFWYAARRNALTGTPLPSRHTDEAVSFPNPLGPPGKVSPMSSVKVSIILPCFNQGPQIQIALDNLRAQTFRNFEIIVVDEGSTDSGTLDTLSRLSGPGLRVVSMANGGVSSARNFGIEHARGEFIFPIGAEDGIEPTLLEKGVGILEANPKAGVVTCGVDIGGRSSGKRMPSGEIEWLLVSCDIAPGSLFRRRCWEEVGGYDETLTGFASYDFWLSIASKRWGIEIIPEYLLHSNEPGGAALFQTDEELHKRFLRKHAVLYESHAIGVIGKLQRIREKEKEAHEKTKNSTSYRLGNALTSPLRKFPSRKFFSWVRESQKQNYFDGSRQLWLSTHRSKVPSFYKRLFCETSVKVPGVGRYRLEKGDAIGAFLYFFRVWEPYITNFVVSSLKPGDVFLDVGANIGYYSVLAGNRVKAAGRVYALEPAPRIFGKLIESLRLNGLHNCRAFNLAASSAKERLPLYAGPAENSGATSHYPLAGNQSAEGFVDAVPAAELIAPEDVKKLRVIKIDVEGHESDVLRGLRSLADQLPDSASILFEYTPNAAAPEKWREITWWLEQGYQLFRIENRYDTGFYLHANPWVNNGIAPVLESHSPPLVLSDLILSKQDLQQTPALARPNYFAWAETEERNESNA